MHEMVAGLCLLDNNQFYYSAIFGSEDVTICGDYAIKENKIIFSPKEDQIQPYILYARKNDTLSSTIRIKYFTPSNHYGQKLMFFATDNQWVKNISNDDDNVLTIKKNKIKKLKIGYPANRNLTHIIIYYLKIPTAVILLVTITTLF